MAIKSWKDDCPPTVNTISDASHRIRPHGIVFPALYFDGAVVDGFTGCGAWIKISDRERIHIHWNGGPGTNNKAEIIALWGSFYCC